MPGLPWITDGSLLWDTLLLGGEVWPGLPTVTSTVSRSIDKQKKKGDDGANLVDQGYEPAKVKIVIRIWLQEQWDDLQSKLATVHPRKKGGVRTPVDIIHPETQLKGVRQIYVEEIGEAVPGTGAQTGMLTITLTASEWFPEPKPAKPNTKKSKAEAKGGDIPSGADILPPNANGSSGALIF